jgi:hypothetical protein
VALGDEGAVALVQTGGRQTRRSGGGACRLDHPRAERIDHKTRSHGAARRQLIAVVVERLSERLPVPQRWTGT